MHHIEWIPVDDQLKEKRGLEVIEKTIFNLRQAKIKSNRQQNLLTK